MEILYSDKSIAVCVKPVGLDSESEVPAALKELLGGEVFPIHRLDKNVGGVMVYARTRQAAAALSKAVQEGSMVKEYVAMVHGAPPQSGDWEDLLWKDSKKNIVFTDAEGHRVRDTNLNKTFQLDISKESLIKQMEENQARRPQFVRKPKRRSRGR